MGDWLKDSGQLEEFHTLLKELHLCNEKLHSFQYFELDFSYRTFLYDTISMKETLTKIYHLHIIREQMYLMLYNIESEYILLNASKEHCVKEELGILKLLYCPFGILREKELREIGHRFLI